MTTIYDILEVSENASKEEIEKAYNKIILEFHIDPKLDSQANRENEQILNKIKIAYEILMDDSKRARYDRELSNKRADELLKNVNINSKNEEKNNFENVNEEIYDQKIEKKDASNLNNQNIKDKVNESNYNTKNKENDNKNESNQKNNVIKKVSNTANNNKKNNEILTEIEKKELRKAAQEEFEHNIKKAEQAEKEYNQAYEQAYNDYFKKQSLYTKIRWRLKKIKNFIIFLLAFVITVIILWLIPPFRKMLINLYEENSIIHILVNFIVSIFKALFGVFKK